MSENQAVHAAFAHRRPLSIPTPPGKKVFRPDQSLPERPKPKSKDPRFLQKNKHTHTLGFSLKNRGPNARWLRGKASDPRENPAFHASFANMLNHPFFPYICGCSTPHFLRGKNPATSENQAVHAVSAHRRPPSVPTPRGKSFPTRPKSPRATKTKIHTPRVSCKNTEILIPSVFPLKVGAQIHAGYEGKLQTRRKTPHFMPVSLTCLTPHFFPTFSRVQRPSFYEGKIRNRAISR